MGSGWEASASVRALRCLSSRELLGAPSRHPPQPALGVVLDLRGPGKRAGDSFGERKPSWSSAAMTSVRGRRVSMSRGISHWYLAFLDARSSTSSRDSPNCRTSRGPSTASFSDTWPCRLRPVSRSLGNGTGGSAGSSEGHPDRSTSNLKARDPSSRNPQYSSKSR